jgi:hypothetical protein
MQPVYEYTGNLHIHSVYSDGTATHAEIAEAAIRSGLDFVIVTDHNVRVGGVEGYYGSEPDRRVLLLTGEEVHDMRRSPQANHLLIYDVGQELATHAARPQELIDTVQAHKGLCFFAHPDDPAAEMFGEPALPWHDRDVEGYTGLELWNYMSEFKSYLTGRSRAVKAALNPEKYISGPFADTLALWDRLLAEGKQTRIIGGADAHGAEYSLGPIRRTIFPYDYLFRCVNTHILTPHPLTGDLGYDKALIYQALRSGHSFVGYDLPAPTQGFRFSAQGYNTSTVMGGWVRLGHGVTLQLASPIVADMRLIRNGKIILTENEGTHRTYIANESGVYRVEVHIEFKGKRRGWIYSNPIFVEK